MTDQAQPTGQGKIIAALTVLVEETRQSKIDLTDIAARQTQHTADNANFQDAISLIQNDDDAYCCGSARASIVQDRDETHYCAIAIPEYQVEEDGDNPAAE